jgi:thiamine biosynthesis lipoprotein
MPTVTLACNAMATRFEIVLHGDNTVALRAAGEEALREIERLENQLSLYRSTSEIAHVNALAARQSVQVTPETFELLRRAQTLHQETAGAFDITIAPLVHCWGFMGGTGHMPTPTERIHALSLVGMQHVLLDDQNFTVRFDCNGVMLDLGAIGKGYAIDRAGEVLLESGISNAMVHGGTSTILALGTAQEGQPWKIALENPFEKRGSPHSSAPHPRPPLEPIALQDQALSVSAIWGRCFENEGYKFGHVIDPRTGEPTKNAVLAAVAVKSATDSDALSTALLTLGPSAQSDISRLRLGMRTWVVTEQEGQLRFYTK